MKKTYRLDKKTMKLVEVDKDAERKKKSKSMKYVSDAHYDGLRATDGTDIGTRKKHREYMHRHGLTTADDYKESWAKAAEQRERYYQKGGTISRSDIARAIHYLMERK